MKTELRKTSVGKQSKHTSTNNYENQLESTVDLSGTKHNVGAQLSRKTSVDEDEWKSTKLWDV